MSVRNLFVGSCCAVTRIDRGITPLTSSLISSHLFSFLLSPFFFFVFSPFSFLLEKA